MEKRRIPKYVEQNAYNAPANLSTTAQVSQTYDNYTESSAKALQLCHVRPRQRVAKLLQNVPLGRLLHCRGIYQWDLRYLRGGQDLIPFPEHPGHRWHHSKHSLSVYVVLQGFRVRV